MASTTTGAPPLPKSSGTNIANANANAPNPCMPGRVLRLHFECRASLLIGSTLHVTASSLWAPGSTAVAELIHDTNNSNNHNNSKDDANDNTKSATAFGSSKHNQNGTDNNNTTTEGSSSSSLYVSSVAMVTTPDTYPVWKTRTPVVVVLNRHAASKHRVQHFYYRYLVVSPGATTTTTTVAQQQQQLMVGSSSSEQPGAAKDGNLSSPMVLTSSSTSGGGSTPVSQWEDPFVGTNNTHLNLFIAPNINNSTEVSSSATTTYARTSVGGGDEEPITANMSTVSLASTVASTYYPSASSTTMDNMNMTTHLHTLADYFNLPYRTLDIDPHHLIPGSTSSSSTTTGATAPGADQDGTTTSTAAEYRPFATDNWNGADDATFQPYLIREAVR